MNSVKLKSKIYFTLLYYNIFDFPITVKEIYSKLLNFGQKNYSTYSYDEFEKFFFQLRDKNFFYNKNNLYGLKRVSLDFNLKRKRLAIWEKTRKKEINFLKNFLKTCPFIRTAFITGSDSLFFADEKNDYDILLVCRKNSLWMVRFYVLMIASFLNKRRKYFKFKNLDWCFNLFLEEDSLIIPKKKRSLFSACELNNMRFLFGDKKIKNSLICQNHFWISKYLSNFKYDKDQNFRKTNFIFVYFYYLLNYFFYFIQISFLRNKITYEFVSYKQAFFHPQKRQNFLKEMLSFLKKDI